MPELTVQLPSRRLELVSWPSGGTGQYLVRNRRTGETFQVGEQEHFLLARLDGSQTAEQLCVAFAARFAQPLSSDVLVEFLELAGERGFLQSGESAETRTSQDDGFQGPSSSPPKETVPARWSASLRCLGSRLLTACAAALQGSAGLLQRASGQVHWLRLRYLDFVPRPDDVFIVTYPRSGTTWLQMILYQLTTDGRMDFPHIAEYCPWFERSQRSSHGFETRPAPRLFKSHLPHRAIPKGPCKYIYVARDGKDVAVSYYHLCRSYNGYEGTFAVFFDRFLRGKVEFGSWFRHVQGWWEHRHDPNVLFLTYEELTGDLEECLRRIIAHCGFEVSAERFPDILERCGFPFMKAHESRFDPALEALWEQGMRLNSFLRTGRVGEGALQLSDEQRARFDAALQRQWAGTGLASNGMVTASE